MHLKQLAFDDFDNEFKCLARTKSVQRAFMNTPITLNRNARVATKNAEACYRSTASV